MQDNGSFSEKRRLGRSNLTVSALGLGGAGIGGIYGAIDDATAIDCVRAAIVGGITYIDTSPLYGESERRLGLALDGDWRDRIVLSTKTGTHPEWPRDYSAEATKRTVASSLRLLRTDHIDVLYVHDPHDLRQALGAGGAVEALEEMRAQGVIGAIGLGVRSHDLHVEAIESGRIDVVLTYLDYNLIRTTASQTILPLARAKDVGVVNGSPLAMGLLSGGDPEVIRRSSPAWAGSQHTHDFAIANRLWGWARSQGLDLQALALQFCMREASIATTIVGAKTAEEIRENMRTANTPIPKPSWCALRQVQGGMTEGEQ